MVLDRVAGVLTTPTFVINLLLDRPLINAVLFSLAIAVGITPQLLPAVVTMSLAAGTRWVESRHDGILPGRRGHLRSGVRATGGSSNYP
jgi:Mg2+-importing ATPase